MTQKFFKGDLVQVGEMPPSMRHFPANCKAIVLYTYNEAYGGGAREDHNYALYILLPYEGETSWYREEQLTLIEPDRFDLLPKGNVHRKAYEAKQQNVIKEKQMSNYKYEQIRPELFNEDGVELLMQMRDHASKLLFQAGAFSFEKVTRTIKGDTWLMIAALDYMIERKEIRKVYDPANTLNAVYTKGELA